MEIIGLAIGVLMVIGVILVIGASIALDPSNREQVRRDWKQAIDHEPETVRQLTQNLNSLLAPDRKTLPPTGPGRLYTGLKPGELTRRFDSNTVASINGWLAHDLAFHGWAVATNIDGLGLGLAKIGLSGTSQVELTSSGTTRESLTGDGFIAILEFDIPTGTDTLRVVVPPEHSVRDIVTTIVSEIGENLRPNSATQRLYYRSWTAFRDQVPKMLAFPYEASYASDRLSAILRRPPASRPAITVYGSPISEHAVLAASIQFSAEEPPQSLFPLDLLNGLQSAVADALAALNPPPQTTTTGTPRNS